MTSKSLSSAARIASPRSICIVVGLLAVSLPIGPAPAAQTPPPMNGTVALEGTMDKFYKAANVVIVKTIDGVEHVFHFTTDLLVHGGKKSGVDALAGLHEGNSVVVHYTVAANQEAIEEIDRVGGGGLQITEGTVVRIDRSRKQITIRFDNGTTESFRLTERAAGEKGTDVDDAGADVPVRVFFTNEAGQKLVHYFRRISSTQPR
jgi:hypothetical protein